MTTFDHGDFLRLQLRVRCALRPDQPECVRSFVQAGLRLERLGLASAMAVHHRLLLTLLATARDEALPWFWRSVCLEHLSLPLARLVSILSVHDPITARSLQWTVQRARDGMVPPPSSAHRPRPTLRAPRLDEGASW